MNPAYDWSDEELPGMWQQADFAGGLITMRFHCKPCGVSQTAHVADDDSGHAAELWAEWNTDHGGCSWSASEHEEQP